jgi:hypothetical protein
VDEIQILGYAAGTMLLFIPGTQVAGAWVLGITAGTDMTEGFYQ